MFSALLCYLHGHNAGLCMFSAKLCCVHGATQAVFFLFASLGGFTKYLSH